MSLNTTLVDDLNQGTLRGKGSLSRAGLEPHGVVYEIFKPEGWPENIGVIQGSLWPEHHDSLIPYSDNEVSILTLGDGRSLSVRVRTFPGRKSSPYYFLSLESARYLEQP